MRKIINQVKKFVKEEDAASAVEYSLLLAFLALGLITAMQSLAQKINSSFSSVGDTLNTASQSGGGGGGGHPPPASPFM